MTARPPHAQIDKQDFDNFFFQGTLINLLQFITVERPFISSVITTPPRWWSLIDYCRERNINLWDAERLYIDRLVTAMRLLSYTAHDDAHLVMNWGASWSSHTTPFPFFRLAFTPYRFIQRVLWNGWSVIHEHPLTKQYPHVLVFRKKQLIPDLGLKSKGTARKRTGTSSVEYQTSAMNTFFRNAWKWPQRFAHPANHRNIFPKEAIEKAVKLGRGKGIVLDPFAGGDTEQVAHEMGVGYMGIELNSEWTPLKLQRGRG